MKKAYIKSMGMYFDVESMDYQNGIIQVQGCLLKLGDDAELVSPYESVEDMKRRTGLPYRTCEIMWESFKTGELREEDVFDLFEQGELTKVFNTIFAEKKDKPFKSVLSMVSDKIGVTVRGSV